MSFDQVIQLIGQLGFPIVVALYLLIRLDQQLHNIDDHLTQIIDAVSKLTRP